MKIILILLITAISSSTYAGEKETYNDRVNKYMSASLGITLRAFVRVKQNMTEEEHASYLSLKTDKLKEEFMKKAISEDPTYLKEMKKLNSSKPTPCPTKNKQRYNPNMHQHEAPIWEDYGNGSHEGSDTDDLSY